MKVYTVMEVASHEDSEIIKVFDSDLKARQYCQRNYNITRYDDSSPSLTNYIDNFIVYYWTDTVELLIQGFVVE